MSLERTKISELTPVSPTGGAIFPIVQDNATVSCNLNDISTYLKDVSITSFTIDPSTTTYEIGDVLTTLKLDWVFNKTPDQISVTIHDGTVYPLVGHTPFLLIHLI